MKALRQQPRSPYFWSLDKWTQHTEDAVLALCCASNQLPWYEPTPAKTLTDIVDGHFPGVDKPVHYHNWTPRASPFHVRARTYAAVAQSIASHLLACRDFNHPKLLCEMAWTLAEDTQSKLREHHHCLTYADTFVDEAILQLSTVCGNC